MHKAFLPLYRSAKRYFLLTGGRGSLKSSNAHEWAVVKTYEGGGTLFTRYTMTSAETSIIPEFKTVIQRLGLLQDFTFTRTKVVNNTTGGFVLFSGIKANSKDQTARLKSLSGIDTWIVEEAEDFNDEKAFDVIDDSIRTSGMQNRVILIMNPTTKEHWIYKRFFAKTNKKKDFEGFAVTMSTDARLEHIHTTYHIADESGFLIETWMDKTRQMIQDVEDKINLFKASFIGTPEKLKSEIYKIWHTSYYYYNRIGGWLERLEGAIYTNWKEGVFDENLPYCYGLDYGLHPDPLAMCRVAIDNKNKKIYLEEIIYQTNVLDIAARFKGLGIKYNDLIICDTNENRTTLSLRQGDKSKGIRGYNTRKATKGQGSIAQGIRVIKDYQIIVTPSSHNAKAELNNYVWNDKKASIPIDDWNHLLDALRYAVRRLNMKKGGGVKQLN
jgi:phage terminase large subunit